MYKDYKRKAKRRGIAFELALEEFKYLVSRPCSMCGESQEPMGVDRKDNTKHYSFVNCQPMCGICNKMKSDYTEKDFDNHIIKIIQHRPELAERAGFVLKPAQSPSETRPEPRPEPKISETPTVPSDAEILERGRMQLNQLRFQDPNLSPDARRFLDTGTH